MFDIMRGAHKMDANILEKGRAALINYAYERRAVTVMKAMAEKAPSEELSKRIKTQAARARRTEAALLRLTGAEYVLLEGSYIDARPDGDRLLAEKIGCTVGEVRDMAKDALCSFCAYYFAENEKSRGGEAAADISALFLRNDEAVRPVPSLVDRARLLGL